MLEIDPTHPEQKSMVIDELFGIFDKLYDLKLPAVRCLKNISKFGPAVA